VSGCSAPSLVVCTSRLKVQCRLGVIISLCSQQQLAACTLFSLSPWGKNASTFGNLQPARLPRYPGGVATFMKALGHETVNTTVGEWLVMKFTFGSAICVCGRCDRKTQIFLDLQLHPTMPHPYLLALPVLAVPGWCVLPVFFPSSHRRS
jgi:hypothetical protein